MRIVVNGKQRVVADGLTVLDLVHDLGLRERNVVVEHNGEPLERSKYGDARVAAGDNLEIVRAVPGG